MQTDSNSHMAGRPQRQRKYDTYIPPERVGRSAIVAENSALETYEVPVTVTQTQHHDHIEQHTPIQTYVEPPKIHIQHAQPTSTEPVIVVKKKLSDFKPKKANSAPKTKKMFSSILRATVRVDKVTRQSVKAVRHSFEPPTVDSLRTKRQKLLVRTFYVVGTASFLLAIGMGFNNMRAKEKPPTRVTVLGAATPSQNDASRASEIPSETVPTKQDMATYLVAQQYPRYIRVPNLSIEARVRRLGVDSKGAVGSPNNINDAGWYDGSVRPGEKDGASIIVGHISGPSQPGIFWDILKLVPGTPIEIEKGNGELVTYKVSKVEKLPAGDIDMTQYVATETPGRHDLKLVTSSGKFETVGDQFAGRVVVFATQDQ